jgi:thiamine-monophosphate kinase
MIPEKSPEFRLIDRVRQLAGKAPGVSLGIGDDAAAVTFESGPAVVTSDMLLEGVHFEIPAATPREVGRKSINVNLSDLAAMAALPRFAVVSVCLPRDRSVGDELMEGIIEAAAEFDVAIIGGDTNAWDGPLIVSVTAIGEAHPKGLVTRSGAKSGDWICVTGELGGSRAGRHLSFTPRVREATILHEAASLTAMLDVSDGLVADLFHILEESQCGAVLDAGAIPISEAARSLAGNRSPLQRALGDGEDFELLFTLPAAEGQRLLARSDLPVRVTRIGEIVADLGCRLREGNTVTELPRLGWSHEVGPGSNSQS